jgi:hypothetical protein
MRCRNALKTGSATLLVLPKVAEHRFPFLRLRPLSVNAEQIVPRPIVTALRQEPTGLLRHPVQGLSRAVGTFDHAWPITSRGLARTRCTRASFLWKCLAVALTVAASTIACGGRRFERAELSDGPVDVRAAEEKGKPDARSVLLRAQTRQTKAGSLIQVLWDASAKPIQRSAYGILYIYDGGIPKKLVLSRRTLDLGSADYRPTSDEVTFHFILERGGSEGDWLLVLLGTPEATHAGLQSDAEGAIVSARPPDPSPTSLGSGNR